MRRVLQNELVDKLSKEILRGAFVAGDTVYVDVDATGLTFSKEPYAGETRYPEGVATPGASGGLDEDVVEVSEAEVEDVG